MTNLQDWNAHSTGEIDEPPEPEHGFDGVRHVSTASYEGRVYACLCGELFVDRNELQKHIGVPASAGARRITETPDAGAAQVSTVSRSATPEEVSLSHGVERLNCPLSRDGATI